MIDVKINAKGCTILYMGGMYSDCLHTPMIDSTHRVSIIPSYDRGQICGEVVFAIEHGKIVKLSQCATAVQWDNLIEINICPPALTIKHSPITIAQVHTQCILATIYDDGILHIMCEGKKFFVQDLPNLVSPRLNVCSLKCGEMVVVQGNVNNEQYLLVLLYNGKWQVLYDITADSITRTENSIISVERIADMRAHTITTTYHDGVPQREIAITSPHVYIEEMIPYLFLESLLIGDERESISYLSPSLSADYNTIVDFVGEYDTITNAPKKGVAIYSSSEHITTPRILNFDIANGLIQNIWQ